MVITTQYELCHGRFLDSMDRPTLRRLTGWTQGISREDNIKQTIDPRNWASIEHSRQQILAKDLKMYPYKVQTEQMLLPVDRGSSVNYNKSHSFRTLDFSFWRVPLPHKFARFDHFGFFLWNYLKSMVFTNKTQIWVILKKNGRE